MVHDARIVHLNAKHEPETSRSGWATRIGWWEGDTLVVETINMRPEQGLRGGGGSANSKVTEWFTRIGPKPDQVPLQDRRSGDLRRADGSARWR